MTLKFLCLLENGPKILVREPAVVHALCHVLATSGSADAINQAATALTAAMISARTDTFDTSTSWFEALLNEPRHALDHVIAWAQVGQNNLDASCACFSLLAQIMQQSDELLRLIPDNVAREILDLAVKALTLGAEDPAATHRTSHSLELLSALVSYATRIPDSLFDAIAEALSDGQVPALLIGLFAGRVPHAQAGGSTGTKRSRRAQADDTHISIIQHVALEALNELATMLQSRSRIVTDPILQDAAASRLLLILAGADSPTSYIARTLQWACERSTGRFYTSREDEVEEQGGESDEAVRDEDDVCSEDTTVVIFGSGMDDLRGQTRYAGYVYAEGADELDREGDTDYA
jgi:hypothetical protein